MKKELRHLKSKFAKIKEKISAIGDLLRGTLSEQYNVCGTAGCKYKTSPPKKQGSYYQLSFTKNGKSSTEFVNRKDAKGVKIQVNNYTRLRKLVTQ